jgi:hypothetical protein
MNIIFKNTTTNLDQKYTVLDLDTFSFPDGSLHTACCVLESIPILELSQTENLKDLHAMLIKEYGQKNWDYCEQAVNHLLGKWGGEVDTFYLELKRRIEQFKDTDLDDSWTPVIPKS